MADKNQADWTSLRYKGLKDPSVMMKEGTDAPMFNVAHVPQAFMIAAFDGDTLTILDGITLCTEHTMREVSSSHDWQDSIDKLVADIRKAAKEEPEF